MIFWVGLIVGMVVGAALYRAGWRRGAYLGPSGPPVRLTQDQLIDPDPQPPPLYRKLEKS